MTTTTTTRRGTMGRWMAAGALAMALGLGMATASEAQYQRVQSAPPAVGSQVWGENGYEYQYTGRGYVATGLRKVPNMPQVYDIYDGSVTSCQLPHPDWQLFAAKFSVTAERATARNSTAAACSSRPASR